MGVEHDDEGVAVGRGLRRRGGADRPGGAGAVVDDDLLSELRGELRTENARDLIDRTAGRERRDDPDWLGRPGLRRGRCYRLQAAYGK